MKILVIGSRFAPIPAVEGGAIEKLSQDYLEYNSKTKKNEIVVYSAYSSKTKENDNELYTNTEFRYIKKNTLKYKLYRIVCGFLRKMIKNKIGDEFIRSVIADLKSRNELDIYERIIILNNINNIVYISKKTQGKHILHLHNDYLNKETPNSKKILEKLDEIWCVSNFIKEQVDTIGSNNKTKVLYNGTNIQTFNKKVNQDKIKKLKEQYSIQEDDFVVLYTGRIMREKGVKELINSFKKAFVNKKAKLLIVGSPTDRNKEYYDELLKENLKTENIFFLGTKSHTEINELYKVSNIQVVPSLWNEAFGLTVIEGMSAGIPVIVSDSGGMPEIVQNECAIIVRRENIENDLIAAFNQIYNMDKAELQVIIDSAKKRVENFSIETYCKNLDKLLSE